MAAHEPNGIIWRKSSYSGGNGNCVEVAAASTGVLVRDSKDPNGPVLAFGAAPWRDFLTAVTLGRR